MEKKTNEKIEEIIEMKILSTIFIILVLGVSGFADADEMVHKFKNPSFRVKNVNFLRGTTSYFRFNKRYEFCIWGFKECYDCSRTN